MERQKPVTRLNLFNDGSDLYETPISMPYDSLGQQLPSIDPDSDEDELRRVDNSDNGGTGLEEREGASDKFLGAGKKSKHRNLSFSAADSSAGSLSVRKRQHTAESKANSSNLSSSNLKGRSRGHQLKMSRQSSISSKEIVQNILFNQPIDDKAHFEDLAAVHMKQRRLGTIADRTDTLLSGVDNPFAGTFNSGGTITGNDEDDLYMVKQGY